MLNVPSFLAFRKPSQAFGQFTTGVQQRGDATAFGTFGEAGQVEFALDLQRLVPDGTVSTNEIAGISRTGSYEGTVTIGTDGSVSFITQGTATPYTTWMNGYTVQIPNALDREPGADPDKDGIENVLEFVLNGNPSVSSQSILPTLNASGSNFVFNFTRRADSAGEAALHSCDSWSRKHRIQSTNATNG